MDSIDPLDEVVTSLVGLVGALNNPRQDDLLLLEAGVVLDRSLFPLVARLGLLGDMSVVALANHSGRDHSTISRQLVVLEREGLVERRADARDRRVRKVALTSDGLRVAKRLGEARRRLLGRLLGDWTPTERRSFARLARKLSEGMLRARQEAD